MNLGVSYSLFHLNEGEAVRIKLDEVVAWNRRDVEIAVGFIGTDEKMRNRIVDVEQLSGWLYGSSSCTDFRTAPSMICRSEIALLGTSSPRFAIRAYLKDANCEYKGFLNLRRMRLLSNRFLSQTTGNQAALNMSTSKAFIADSLLAVPERFQSNFHMLTTSIASEFSEPQIEAVPFLQMIRLGGGLCAQACAWMVAAHLYEFVTAVHGLSEISYIANVPLDNHGTEAEISIDGLDFDQLGEYFHQIGLVAPVHFINARRHEELKKLSFVFDSYIRSGIPLIAAVDLGRLTGQAGSGCGMLSVYQANDLPDNLRPRVQLAPQHHAVVVTGFNSKSESCIISDPASVPFISLTLADLVHRRSYGRNFDEVSFRLVDENLSEQFRFQAVLPDGVHSFLTSWTSGKRNEADVWIGLDWIFDYIGEEFWECHGLSAIESSQVSRSIVETELRLVNSRSESSKSVLETYSSPVPAELWRKLKASDMSWFWIQRVTLKEDGSSVLWLVWNASRSIGVNAQSGGLANALAEKLLVAMAVEDAISGLRFPTDKLYVSDVVIPACGSQLPTQTREVRIISSCFPLNTQKGFSLLREKFERDDLLHIGDALPIELYVAMENDCAPLADELNCGAQFANGELTVVDLLAQGWKQLVSEEVNGSQSALENWTRSLGETYDANRFRIDGLASFIPEVSSSDQNIRDLATNALAALQTVAYFLSRSHCPQFIEIVGGTLFDRLLLEENVGTGLGGRLDCWKASVVSRTQAISNIGDSLTKACLAFRMVFKKAPIAFLVELEPGPQFVLNSIDSLSELSKSVDMNEVELGFNLDVGHFRLANQSCLLLKSPQLFGGFKNCHVSGHGKGHFGDLPLSNELNQTDSVLLSEYLSMFSRPISLELEAAPSVEAVSSSYRILRGVS